VVRKTMMLAVEITVTVPMVASRPTMNRRIGALLPR